MTNYKNSKIYKITSPSNPDLVYIGSTTQSLKIRFSQHKSMFKRYKKGKVGYVTSFKIIEYSDCKIELIKNVCCNNRKELDKIEGEFILNTICCNKFVAGRTNKQYHKDNKEKINARRRAIYKAKKEKINARRRVYREANKEKIKARRRVYHEANKEKSKAYYEANKEKINAKDKAYREANKAKINAQRRAKNKAKKEKDKKTFVEALPMTFDEYKKYIINNKNEKDKNENLETITKLKELEKTLKTRRNYDGFHEYLNWATTITTPRPLESIQIKYDNLLNLMYNDRFFKLKKTEKARIETEILIKKIRKNIKRNKLVCDFQYTYKRF